MGMKHNVEYIEQRAKDMLWLVVEAIENGGDVKELVSMSMAVTSIRYNAMVRDRKNND